MRTARPTRSAATALLACLPALTLAQSLPSQLPPVAPRQGPEPPSGPLQLPAPVPQALPAQADQLSFRPGPLRVEGELAQLVPEREALAARWLTPVTRVSALFALAQSLEEAYSRAGYVLARVSVPAQSLRDGEPVRLVVTDGRIEAVDVDEVPQGQRQPVQALLQPLVNQPWLTLSRIEQALALADELPGLRLRSALAAGSAPGTTRLLLSGVHARTELLTSVDNRLSESLGRWQWSARLGLNSWAGLGEQAWAALRLGRTRAGQSHPDLQAASLGLNGPPTADGQRWRLEWTDSRLQGQVSPGALESVGRMRRWSLGGDVARSAPGDSPWRLGLSLDSVTQRSTARLFGVDLSLDEYTAARWDLDAWGALPFGARWQVHGQPSLGLGGRDRGDARRSGVPLSRQGAGPDFIKLQAQVDLGGPLGSERWRWRLMGAAQSSLGQPLLQPEQLSLDGEQGVAGLPPGSLAVDQGGVLRAELGWQGGVSWADLAWRLQPYLHAARGRGRYMQPTALEAARRHGSSAGLGVQLDGLGGAPLALQAEWTPWARATAVTDDQRQRWSVRLSGRF